MPTKNTTPSTPASTPATAAKTPDRPIQTKHLAAQFKMKATALRRVLRTMPDYADGVHTNYRWAENDPRIAVIAAKLKSIAKEKDDRAKAAKAALDARAATLAKQAAVDAKLVPAKA